MSFVNFNNNGIKYSFGFTMYMKYIRIKLKEMLTMSKKCVENIESLTEAVKRMNKEEVERKLAKEAKSVELAKEAKRAEVERELAKKANLAGGTHKINKR